MTEAFFVRDAPDRFVATPLTRGPWDESAQHGGPPAALAGHLAETRPGAREDMQVSRLTVEIFRPVPVAPLRADVRVIHAGRSIEVTEVVLTPDHGRAVMRATAARIRTDERAIPAAERPAEPTADLPGPGESSPEQYAFPFEDGYHTAMESRFAAGSFLEPGPAACWMRMRVPLIAGEPIRPLSRVLVAADSGNGISNVLDFSRYVFINPDLSATLYRYPKGEWVCIESRTTIGRAGIGMADTVLHDEDGPLGHAAQSLFIEPRRR